MMTAMTEPTPYKPGTPAARLHEAGRTYAAEINRANKIREQAALALASVVREEFGEGPKMGGVRKADIVTYLGKKRDGTPLWSYRWVSNVIDGRILTEETADKDAPNKGEQP